MLALRSLLGDSPEYEQRKGSPFYPTEVSLARLRAVIPKKLYEKSTLKALLYILRDISFLMVFYCLALNIDTCTNNLAQSHGFPEIIATLIRWTLWFFYWICQGIVMTGLWILAHEAGHGSLSQYQIINHLIGFSLHTFLLVPFYSWRATHHAHHKATGSVERDENFIPRERSKYGLPCKSEAKAADYREAFEETPIYTLLRMLFMQSLGLQCYFFMNTLGSARYPPGTNHFSLSSPLFRPHQRKGVLASDLGIVFMTGLLYQWSQAVGYAAFIKLYFIPYLFTNHWIVMITFLHHSDPTIPHYRDKKWTFVRGALTTVDRPFLGWVGRFFFHNISHDHIAHHLFSSIPFYNLPQVTEHLKHVLKEDYNYDPSNVFRALYRSFTECCFIEDEGDIVLYMNKYGHAARSLGHQCR